MDIVFLRFDQLLCDSIFSNFYKITITSSGIFVGTWMFNFCLNKTRRYVSSITRWKFEFKLYHRKEQSHEWNMGQFNFLSSIDISGFPIKSLTYGKSGKLTIFRKRRGPYNGQQDSFLYQLVSASSYRDFPLERCNREEQPLVNIMVYR